MNYKRVIRHFSIMFTMIGLALSISIGANAATSKTGQKVKGSDVLLFMEENIPIAEEMEEDGKEAEVAVIVQTRAIASLPDHGFTVVNYGAVLSKDGTQDGTLPRLMHKKNPNKSSWKYITGVSPALYMQEFTNTNEDYGIYQKKENNDAYKEETVYYAAIGAEGKKQLISLNYEGAKDKANAQYINPESDFYEYDIKDPQKDEVIGKMFIEVKKPSAKPEKERLK